MGTRGLKVSGTKSPASKNHTAFIMLLRITSSEKGVVGAGYSFLNYYYYYFIYLFILFIFFCLLLLLLLLFLGPLPRHMEVPRLGVESEL